MSKDITFECSAVTNGVEIEFTNHCGLDCPVCIRKECNNYGFLSMESLRNIMIHVAPKGYTEIVISGLGDAFLHPDFFKLIDIIFSYIPKVKIYIMTKGQSLTDEQIDTISEYKKNGFKLNLSFSIFSLQPDKYKLLTGGGDLDMLIRKIKRSYAYGIDFSLEFFVSLLTIKEISKFKKIAEQLSANFSFTVPHNWGGMIENKWYESLFKVEEMSDFIRLRSKEDICEAFSSDYLFFDYKGVAYKCSVGRFKKHLELGVLETMDLDAKISKLDYSSCNSCSYSKYKTNIG